MIPPSPPRNPRRHAHTQTNTQHTRKRDEKQTKGAGAGAAGGSAEQARDRPAEEGRGAPPLPAQPAGQGGQGAGPAAARPRSSRDDAADLQGACATSFHFSHVFFVWSFLAEPAKQLAACTSACVSSVRGVPGVYGRCVV